MREAVSNILHEAEIVSVAFGDETKCVGQIDPGIEARQRPHLKESFDGWIVDHELPHVGSEVMLSEAAGQDDCRAIRLAVICGNEALIVVKIESLSFHAERVRSEA
jgi:hypothetical protein